MCEVFFSLSASLDKLGSKSPPIRTHKMPFKFCNLLKREQKMRYLQEVCLLSTVCDALFWTKIRQRRVFQTTLRIRKNNETSRWNTLWNFQDDELDQHWTCYGRYGVADDWLRFPSNLISGESQSSCAVRYLSEIKTLCIGLNNRNITLSGDICSDEMCGRKNVDDDALKSSLLLDKSEPF